MKLSRTSIIIAAVALLLGLGLVCIPTLVSASGNVGIDSRAVAFNQPITYQPPADGVAQQPQTLPGVYTTYDPHAGLDIHWTPIAGATYYQVSLIQYTPPNVGPGGPQHEIKVAHHAANDPNGAHFHMDSFGVDEWFCLDCVTVIHIIPETMQRVTGPDGGFAQQYSLLPGGYTSDPFVFQLPVQLMGGPDKDGSIICGDKVCGKGEGGVGGPRYCPTDCHKKAPTT